MKVTNYSAASAAIFWFVLEIAVLVSIFTTDDRGFVLNLALITAQIVAIFILSAACGRALQNAFEQKADHHAGYETK